MKKKIILYVALAILTLGLIGGATAVFASGVLEPDSEETDQVIDASSVSVTEDQAKQTVLSQYPNAVIGQVELEDENGTIVYGIQITTDGLQYDVKVDATTNLIVHADSDGGDQADEAQDTQETDSED